METLTKRASLTLLQVTAAAYIDSPHQQLQTAVACLMKDEEKGNIPPRRLWQKLVRAAIKKGDSLSLRHAYEFWGNGAPTAQMYVRCGNNAMKNLNIFHMIESFQMAGRPIPAKEFLAAADTLFTKAVKNEKVDLKAVLALYASLENTPPPRLVEQLLKKIIKQGYFSWYLELCEFVKEVPCVVTLEGFYEQHVLLLDSNSVFYLAELLHKKLTYRFLVGLGNKAFAEGKFNDGNSFFEKAFQLKK